MIENLAKVLVVDNEQSEIDKISKVLNDLKIPAYYSTYSPANPPDNPLMGIRLAFFDIQLLGGKASDKQVVNSFVNAIKHHLSIMNGPYILIFWSSHIDLIEKITEFIVERESGNIPTPIFIGSIDKSIAGEPERLLDELKKILTNEIIELLFDYETKISQAAGKTLSTIFEVVSNGEDKWGESSKFEENFDTVFSNIAIESLGYNHAKENPIIAIKKGLNPILTNELNSINLTEIWKSKLKTLINSANRRDIERMSSDHIGKLNLIYHLDYNTEGVGKTDRGVCITLNADDNFLNANFGKNTDLLKMDFLPFNGDRTSSKERKKIRNNSQFVLLEISAACDFAQNNDRNHSYILGLISEAFDKNKLMDRRSESLIELPFLILNGSQFYITFNSRYNISFYKNSPQLGDIHFRIKDELLNKITTDHSNYISRLGIISFR